MDKSKASIKPKDSNKICQAPILGCWHKVGEEDGEYVKLQRANPWKVLISRSKCRLENNIRRDVEEERGDKWIGCIYPRLQGWEKQNR